MRLRKLCCDLSFWVGLLALLVSGLAQNDLSRNVLDAALTDLSHHGSAHTRDHASGAHYMPDGTWMAGEMGGAAHGDEYTDPAKDGAHSHKGHSDCVLCGPLAAMAAFTHPPLVLLVLPEACAISVYHSAEREIVLASLHAPYASRAPPQRQA